MFVSLNKKIIYSIFSLFLITSIIFVYTFYIVYGNKIQEEQNYSIQRNQQYIDLLYRNINITKEFRRITAEHPELKVSPGILTSISTDANDEKQIKLLSLEQKQIRENTRSFDERYRAISESMKILGISSILIILAIFFLGYLINWWILYPINKITDVSQKVSQGDLSVRIENKKHPKFTDELYFLTITFNNMLDNLRKFISEAKEQEAFLQALIDSIPDGIRVIDKNYNIIISNKAYRKQVGSGQTKYTKCYQASQNLNAPCSREKQYCPVQAILKNKQDNIKVIQQFCGHPSRHLSINAAPLHHTGKEKYIVESIRDLSDDINFSHQQKLSSLGFLSTSIAHEIKNHLGALRIITERLIDKFYANRPNDDEEKKHLTLIYNELLNCIDVPERLLKLTRSNSDGEQKIDCAAAVEDVIALLDFEAKSKGINISFVPPKEPACIFGNEADFKMVAINIILNALKAIEDKGEINIAIKNTSRGVKISFADTGVGIPPENLSRIFDPFFSDGHDSTQKGNGLGLSISKSIVEKFGGHIHVESEVGAGSCFTLSFPPIKNLAKKKL